MIQEFCLIPKNIVEKYLINNHAPIENNLDEDFHITKRVTSELPATSFSNNKNLVEELIKQNIPKNKHIKSLNFYNYLKNIPILKLLPNGKVIAPVKDLDLIEFIKDSVSNIPKKN